MDASSCWNKGLAAENRLPVIFTDVRKELLSARVNLAEARVNLAEARVNLAEARVNLAEARVNLAEARVECAVDMYNLTQQQSDVGHDSVCEKTTSATTNMVDSTVNLSRYRGSFACASQKYPPIHVYMGSTSNDDIKDIEDIKTFDGHEIILSELCNPDKKFMAFVYGHCSICKLVPGETSVNFCQCVKDPVSYSSSDISNLCSYLVKGCTYKVAFDYYLHYASIPVRLTNLFHIVKLVTDDQGADQLWTFMGLETKS
jgi:hypothetical protein